MGPPANAKKANVFVPKDAAQQSVVAMVSYHPFGVDYQGIWLLIDLF